MDEWVVIGLSLVGGFAVGAVLVLLAQRRPPPKVETRVVVPRAQAPLPLATPEPAAPAPRAPPAPAARPTPAASVEDVAGANVPTEWARRLTGPLEPGRTQGVCSGCRTALSVSSRRPLRIRCPECGRQRLMP